MKQTLQCGQKKACLWESNIWVQTCRKWESEPCDVWNKSVPDRGNIICKGPEARHTWCVQRIEIKSTQQKSGWGESWRVGQRAGGYWEKLGQCEDPGLYSEWEEMGTNGGLWPGLFCKRISPVVVLLTDWKGKGGTWEPSEEVCYIPHDYSKEIRWKFVWFWHGPFKII